MTAALERRYRRLLLAYPRTYRHRHGTEILTTLMDAAPPGRDRPVGREVRNLVAGGLRQRFRLPVGRAMIAVAVLSALILGSLGAAVGSALGWATASAFPRDAELRRIADVVAEGAMSRDYQRLNQIFGLRPEVYIGLATVPNLSADAARSRLAADGWRVGPITERSSNGTWETGEPYRSDDRMFVATKDGIEVTVLINVTSGWPTTTLVTVEQVEPWPALPLTLGGLVSGLLAGWLLTARVGYRVRRLSPWLQMPPVVAATVATAALGLSGLLTYPAVGQMVVNAISADPMSPDRLRPEPPFAVYQYDASLNSLSLIGLGALAVLVVLAYTLPARALGGEPGSPDENEGLPYAA